MYHPQTGWQGHASVRRRTILTGFGPKASVGRRGQRRWWRSAFLFFVLGRIMQPVGRDLRKCVYSHQLILSGTCFAARMMSPGNVYVPWSVIVHGATDTFPLIILHSFSPSPHLIPPSMQSLTRHCLSVAFRCTYWHSSVIHTRHGGCQ